jgi:hypothetical protein
VQVELIGTDRHAESARVADGGVAPKWAHGSGKMQPIPMAALDVAPATLRVEVSDNGAYS